MKIKGLCSTCDSSMHCVLTAENGVLECEEFLAGGQACYSKVAARSKKLCVGTNVTEELQD